LYWSLTWTTSSPGAWSLLCGFAVGGGSETLRLRRGIRKPYTDPRHGLECVPTDDHTHMLEGATVDVVAPRTLMGPANVPHAFTNVGDVRLKQVDIHLSPKFITEWL